MGHREHKRRVEEEVGEVIAEHVPLVDHYCRGGALKGNFGTKYRKSNGDEYIKCEDCPSTGVIEKLPPTVYSA